MRKILLFSIAVVSMMLSNANAYSGYEGRTYFAFHTGITKKDQTITSILQAPNSGSVIGVNRKSRLRPVFDLAYGYHITDSIRMDASLTASRTKFKHSYSVANPANGSTVVLVNNSGSTSQSTLMGNMKTDLQVQRFAGFVNIYADLFESGQVVPYIGFGFGGIHDSVKHKSKLITANLSSKSKMALGYQVSSGANFHVGQGWDAHFGVKHVGYKVKKKRKLVTERGTVTVSSVASGSIAGAVNSTVISRISGEQLFLIGLRRTF